MGSRQFIDGGAESKAEARKCGVKEQLCAMLKFMSTE